MSKAVVDQTNLDYYTKVQEDMRVVLKSLGSAFGSMAALPIAELNHEGKGGVQARFCAHCNCKDVIFGQVINFAYVFDRSHIPRSWRNAL